MRPSSKPKNMKRFIAEFERGDAHSVLAERYGVSRHTIAAWIKAEGLDPSKNVKRRREARRQALIRQLRAVQRLNGERTQAMLQLASLAEREGVKPLTLAHWAEGTGHYKPGAKVNLRAGRPRRLPRRRSRQGAALAREVEAAAAPWTPRHVAGLLRANDRNFTPA